MAIFCQGTGSPSVDPFRWTETLLLPKYTGNSDGGKSYIRERQHVIGGFCNTNVASMEYVSSDCVAPPPTARGMRKRYDENTKALTIQVRTPSFPLSVRSCAVYRQFGSGAPRVRIGRAAPTGAA